MDRNQKAYQKILDEACGDENTSELIPVVEEDVVLLLSSPIGDDTCPLIEASDVWRAINQHFSQWLD